MTCCVTCWVWPMCLQPSEELDWITSCVFNGSQLDLKRRSWSICEPITAENTETLFFQLLFHITSSQPCRKCRDQGLEPTGLSLLTYRSLYTTSRFNYHLMPQECLLYIFTKNVQNSFSVNLLSSTTVSEAKVIERVHSFQQHWR